MEAEITEVKRVSGHLRCSNNYMISINHKICECRTGAKSVRKQKRFGLYLLIQGRTRRLIHVMDLFKVL